MLTKPHNMSPDNNAAAVSRSQRVRNIFGPNIDRNQAISIKEKQIHQTSLKLGTKNSPAVLIPSVAPRSRASTMFGYGDHPELMISPRSGDIVSPRGVFYLGRRRKLIIGSIGRIKVIPIAPSRLGI